MAQSKTNYCDSKILEQNWFLWLVADSLPSLEGFRKHGCLWTRVPRSVVSPSGLLRSPVAVVRQHVIVGDKLYAFASNGSQVDDRAIPCTTEIQFGGGYVSLPSPAPVAESESITKMLQDEDFFQEVPAAISYGKLSTDILNICSGVAVKFHPKSDEEKHDYVHGAFSQMLQKIKDRRLVYLPGKASVFNLLTTTAWNCLFSIVNKDNRAKNKRHQLAEGLVTGAINPNTRSLKASKPS